MLFRWILERLNLQDVTLTNNPAETSNAVFKEYLRHSGNPKRLLNEKKTYEVLLACKNYLEYEWQNSDMANYGLGDFEIKDEFKNYLEKNMNDMPLYVIPTAQDMIEETNEKRTGNNLMCSFSFPRSIK